MKRTNPTLSSSTHLQNKFNKNSTNKLLQRKKADKIDIRRYNRLRYHGLPKQHKPNVPMCPIVSAFWGSPTYEPLLERVRVRVSLQSLVCSARHRSPSMSGLSTSSNYWLIFPLCIWCSCDLSTLLWLFNFFSPLLASLDFNLFSAKRKSQTL